MAQTADGGTLLSFADWRTGQLRRERRREVVRWGASFVTVLAVTGGVVLWVMHLPPPVMPVPEPPPAAIAIDLAPEPVSTPTPPTDAPVGPQQTVSVPDPQPEPPPRITAPPSPAPNPPLVVPKEEKRKIIKKKTKPTLLQKKPIPDKTPPAEATTAPPSSEAPPAPDQAAPAPGASSSHAAHDPVTWQGALLAQLEKFKRYPAEAQADRQEGTAYLHFAMDRKGHVLSATIETSSGHSLLDQETLALVRRAEPLPVPPDEVKGDPITLTVPVEFYIHPN
ncbi:energy transducer TonB [Gluconacetobacter sp. 1b LMG 1731]|uniref:Energy transducer TonB n=2 Tax=Gluconacetobacter dulcium TaxID=2729096 RepID=A0A7W4IL41_9PROT|nr:energy transducer TonB [Gluconacetobacter dulcium]MBB2164870.1 energy transducer TonB [Gluconacetobacter dulcium]MBB2194067.1 energy transducer TonB [Gluconacetobacter dulcium]MBB2198486.1 energy transducer TonB [Gluconacetobacter dulcium]